jgi:hypothetical protein
MVNVCQRYVLNTYMVLINGIDYLIDYHTTIGTIFWYHGTRVPLVVVFEIMLYLYVHVYQLVHACTYVLEYHGTMVPLWYTCTVVFEIMLYLYTCTYLGACISSRV